MSKPTSTVDPARSTLPRTRQARPLQVPHGADRVRLEPRRPARASLPTVTVTGRSPRCDDDVDRVGDEPHQVAGLGADGYDADVLDGLPPRLGHVAPPSLSWARTG